jgi:hypothetical protein
MLETWRPVAGYEGAYEVSDHGRVRSVRRWVEYRGGKRRAGGLVLKPVLTNRFHLSVNLYQGGRATSRTVHSLVLEAFVGARPDGLHGCHNDGDPNNNHVGNLRWDTPSGNILDSVRHGTHNEARKTHCVNGHEYTAENTRWARGGRKRVCRACHRARESARWHRKKAAA